ncbi:MAG TPA: tetratricopeptide repeat protein, partial [Anaeromyxobacteraceae bacterium]|nr:tetratricopeptide repeat protein [Anaeromyxobacteraceae bacterium]
ASFFQVVEAAESARAHPAGPAVTPIPMPTVSVYPVVQAPGYPPGYPQPYPQGYPQPPYPQQPPFAGAPPAAPGSPALTPAPPRPSQPATPPQRSARPVGRAVDVKLDEQELGAVKRGGAWKVLLALLVVAAGGAGGLYFWKPELLGFAPRRGADSHQVPLTIAVQPPGTAPTVGDPVSPAEAREPSPPEQSPLPAPVPVGEAPLPKSPEPMARPEPEKAAPAPVKGPKQLVADADRLRGRGAVEKALALYEKVIEAQPDNARALAGRGLCYLDLQQYALAEQSFRAALQADPEEADALLGLAEAARYQGKKSEAIQHYERYLALHPDGDDAVAARNAINQLKE